VKQAIRHSKSQSNLFLEPTTTEQWG